MAIIKFTKEYENEKQERFAKMQTDSSYQTAKLIYTDSSHLPRALSTNTMLYTVDTRELFIGSGTGIKRVNIGSDINVIDRSDYLLNETAERDYLKKDEFESGDFANSLKAYTDKRISDVVGNAPEALDTLKEISDALNGAPDFATSILNTLDGKVDKEEGKGLSESNFTAEEKSKLSNIESGAQVNTITGIRGAEDPVFYTGNIVLGCENIGAAAVNHEHDGSLKLGSSYYKPLTTSAVLATDTFNTAIGKLEVGLENAKSALDAIPNDIVSGASFEERIQEINNSISEADSALDGRITSLETSRETINLTIGEHASDISEHGQSIDFINEQLEGINKKVSDLVDSYNEAGQSTDDTISALRANLGALQGTVDGHTSDIQTNEGKISANETAIKALENALGATDAKAIADKAELSTSISELSKNKASNTVTFEEYLSPGKNKIQSGDSLTITLQKLQAQIDWLAQHAICDS